jgi:hypothetical protein
VKLDRLSGTGPAVSAAEAVAAGFCEAVPVFGSELGKAAAVLQMLNDKPEKTPLGQAGIGVARHGCVRSRLVGRTSTRSGLTPPCH